MKSMILFMVYYGKLPNYFNLWLKAVENNNSIDFCIITDLIDKKEMLPPNIKLLNIPYEIFKEKIQNAFPFKVSIKSLGRISQFRPALAYIFPEIVKNYDYWGFIECDLIPGNIREFITDDILEKNQKIFKLGHFQIFKNNEYMNTLFMQRVPSALSYKFAYKNNILFFEELVGMHNIASAKNVSTYEENVFSDINCSSYIFKNSIYGYNDLPIRKFLFEYKNGELYRYYVENNVIVKEKTLYVHLQKRTMKIETNNYNSYLIIPNSFINCVDINPEFFNNILKRCEMDKDEYEYSIKEKLNNDSKKRNRQLCWWILRIIRLRIRLFGGIDLNGK